MTFLYIVFLILVFYAIKIYCEFQERYNYWKKKGVKSLKPIFPFGDIAHIFTGKRGLADIIEEWYRECENEKVLGVYIIKNPTLIIKDPEVVKRVLVKDFNVFMDRGMYYNEKTEPFSGQLFKIEGERWRTMRNKLSACFTLNKLKSMFPTIVEVGKQMEKSLEKEVDDNYNISNMEDLTLRFAADVIASTIFGLDSNSFVEKNNTFFSMAQNLFISKSHRRMVMAALQCFFPEFFRFFDNYIKFETVKAAQIEFLYKVVSDVNEHRKKTGIERNDLMQLLLQLMNDGVVSDKTSEKTKPENNVCLTLDEVVATAYTFFFAGYETSSSAISFLLYECALNEELQKKLRDEIDGVLKKYDDEVTYEAISEMKFLEMMISETLRMYPPLGFLQRSASSNYTIPELNLEIEKGTKIFLSVNGLHRDEKNFTEPQKFDPSRFEPNTETKFDSFSYLPFGEGPRNCIGRRLGWLMTSVGVISILRKFRVSICDMTEIPLKMNIKSYSAKTCNPIFLQIDH